MSPPLNTGGFASFWTVLGIEPTRDETAIRRAYARLLRTTNPEDNPDGFKALREAYETALNAVRNGWIPDEDDDESGDEDPDAGAIEESDASAASEPFTIGREEPTEEGGSPPLVIIQPSDAPDEPPAPGDPELDQHEAARTALAEALRNAAPPEELRANLAAVLRAPAMDRLGVYSDTEGWLAWLIYNGQPASYALLDPVIDYFRLDRGPDVHGNISGLVHMRNHVAQQGAAEAFIARVQKPGHEFHRAWLETSKPMQGRSALSRWWAGQRVGQVARFFHQIEQRTPMAAQALDADAVAWWRKRIGAKRRGFMANMGVLAWAGLILAAVIYSGVDSYLRKSGDPSRATYERLRGLDNPLLAVTPPTTKPQTVAVIAKPVRQRARQECLDAVLAVPSAGRHDAKAGPEACGEALTLMPESLQVMQAAGILALRTGDASSAYTHFAAILETSPDDPFAAYGLALAALAEAPQAKPKDAALAAWALKTEPAVAEYFKGRGVSAPADLKPAEEAPVRLVAPPNPVRFYSSPLKERTEPDAAKRALDAATMYFGMTRSGAGEVTMVCLIRASGRMEACRIAKETPMNAGLGEIVLKLADALRWDPEMAGDDPVDNVPLRYTFRITN